MMATALGPAVQRGSRRPPDLPPGLWLLVIDAAAVLAGPVERGEAHPRVRPGSGARPPAAEFLRGYMWFTAPWLLFQVMRNFVSALERPRLVLWLSIGGIPLNALVSWSLIFGHFGLPALGLFGGGLGSTIVWLAMAARSGNRHSRPTASSAVSTCSAACGAPTGRDRRQWSGSAGRSALTMGLRGRVRAAAYFMGLIGAPAVAAHAVALQIAARPSWCRSASARRRRSASASRSAASDEAGIDLRRLDGVGARHRLHGRHGAADVGVPAPADHLFLDDVPANAAVIALGRQLPAGRRRVPARRRRAGVGAGMLRGLHDTRVADALRAVRLLGVGLGVGAWLAFALTGRASASGSGSPPGWLPSRC